MASHWFDSILDAVIVIQTAPAVNILHTSLKLEALLEDITYGYTGSIVNDLYNHAVPQYYQSRLDLKLAAMDLYEHELIPLEDILNCRTNIGCKLL